MNKNAFKYRVSAIVGTTLAKIPFIDPTTDKFSQWVISESTATQLPDKKN